MIFLCPIFVYEFGTNQTSNRSSKACQARYMLQAVVIYHRLRAITKGVLGQRRGRGIYTTPLTGSPEEIMARPTSLNRAKKDILSQFSETSQKVYSETRSLVYFVSTATLGNWPRARRVSDFISFLEKDGKLKKVPISLETLQPKNHSLLLGPASLYELALSIKQRAYLCHATAVTLHGLAKLSRKTIYLKC